MKTLGIYDQTICASTPAPCKQNAYAPYSNFKSGGRALRTGRGAIFVGCNVENAGLTPRATCAESGAIAAMIAARRNCLCRPCDLRKAMPVHGPAGGCLRNLAEFGAGGEAGA